MLHHPPNRMIRQVYYCPILPVLEIIVPIAVVLALIYLIADRTFSAPRYRGPTTNHFNSRKFRNLDPSARRGLIDVLRWKLTSRRGHWNRWTDSHPGSAPPRRVN